MPENIATKYRTPGIFMVLGVLTAVVALLVDLVGLSAPGIGEGQWVALCLAGILTILGLAMLLAALPDP